MAKKSPNLRGQDGFNLVSVLVSLGLISMLGMLASRAYISSKQVKQSLKAGESYEQVQDVLVDSLKTFVKTKVSKSDDPCADPSGFFGTHPFLRKFEGKFETVRSARPSSVNANAWNEVFGNAFNAKSFAGTALNRCSNTELGINGRFHFCLSVQRDENAPTGSILRSPFAFVEVAVQLFDLQVGTPITCSMYLETSRKTAGASVDYLMFWLTENGSNLDLKKKNGSFYVSR